MTTRQAHTAADPIDAFEAAQEVLERAVTEGAFRILIDESPSHFAIGWGNRMSGARYDFRFARAPDGAAGTAVTAQLDFSGLMGPLLTLMRGRGNSVHLDKILTDIKTLAESPEFYDDSGDGDDDDEDDAANADLDAEQKDTG